MLRSQRRIEPAPLIRAETCKIDIRPKRSAKSRGGCGRCKSRHIKCDEARPQCNRCTEKQLTCPGYVKTLKWSTRYEGHQFAPATTSEKNDASHQARTEIHHDSDSPKTQAKAHRPVAELTEKSDLSSTSDDSQDLFATPAMSSWETTSCFELTENEFFPLDDATWTTEDMGSGLSQELSEDSTIIAPATDAVLADLPVNELFSCEDSGQVGPEISDDVAECTTVQLRDVHSSTRSYSSGSIDCFDHADASQLLSWFYRMSPRQYTDTDLVEYYFHSVCRLYALFDSTQNPFRVLVGNNWGNSKSIRLAIESMACGHLANREPFMEHLGKQKRHQARTSILCDVELWRSGNSSANQVLLAILLLGLSVSWHDASDIGEDLVDAAREIVQSRLNIPQPVSEKHSDQLQHFFDNAMVYYEMLMSFVLPAERSMPSGMPTPFTSPISPLASSGSGTSRQLSTVTVHPWTGVTPYVMILFAEAGRVVRWCLSEQCIITDREIEWASSIELALKTAQIPSCENVVDHGDANTPKEHLIMLAEAYRWAGLLLIYHAIPQLLSNRLTAIDGSVEDAAAKSEALSWYRVNLALRILQILEKLPLSSGTQCLQPILLLTAGSELRFHAPTLTINFIAQPLHSQVASARVFAEGRLRDLVDRLPQKPYIRMIEIMKETWLHLDVIGTDIHWTQVMSTKGWETIMG